MESTASGAIEVTTSDVVMEEEINVVDLGKEPVEKSCPDKKQNDTPQVLQDPLNTLIHQLTVLCARKLSAANASSEDQNPTNSVETTTDKKTVVPLRSDLSLPKRKRSSDHFYRMVSEKMDQRFLSKEDSDRHFLYSLLPHIKNVSEDDKLDLKIECLAVFKKFAKKY